MWATARLLDDARGVDADLGRRRSGAPSPVSSPRGSAWRSRSSRWRGRAASLADRVGRSAVFIDHVPVGLKDLAIDWFGMYDKVALVVSIAAGVGRCCRDHRSVGIPLGRSRMDHRRLGRRARCGRPRRSRRCFTTRRHVVGGHAGRRRRVGRRPQPHRAVVVVAIEHRGHERRRGELRGDGRSGDGPGRRCRSPAVRGRSPRRRSDRSRRRTARAIAARTVRERGRPGNRCGSRSLVFGDRRSRRPCGRAPGLSTLFTANSRFYRVDTALVLPTFDLDDWRLQIGGMVDSRAVVLVPRSPRHAPRRVGRDAGMRVERGWRGPLVGNARWLGVPLATLLERAGVQPQADQVLGRSVDGFTAGFPVTALDGREATARGRDEWRSAAPRARFPGPPGRVRTLRLRIRNEVAVVDRAHVVRHRGGLLGPAVGVAEAPVKTQLPFIDHVVAASTPDHTLFAGVAWAPSRGIAAVEVQVDEGPWQPAQLGPSLGDDVWRQWWIDWEASPGSHAIRCRATDGDGELQVEAPSDLAPDGATGWHERRVTVS